MTRDILRHLWRPQTGVELARGTGYRHHAVLRALTTLQMAGLAVRKPVSGRRGIRWVWEASR